MRISDWSSDVCSSDLQPGRFQPRLGMRRLRAIAAILGAAAGLDAEQGAKLNLAARVVAAVNALRLPHQFVEWQVEQFRDFLARPVGAGVRHPIASSACARSAMMSSICSITTDTRTTSGPAPVSTSYASDNRSEEHTSELQSLMRI